MSVCLLLSDFLCFSLSISEISATSADCHIVCVLFVSMSPPCVFESKVINEPKRSEVGFVAVCFNQLIGRTCIPLFLEATAVVLKCTYLVAG